MNKCILARIYKNCKAQCGQYRIQKESMWVNIKWRIILICEESIPARNWTADLLHPRAAGLPVALPENVDGCALFLLSILSCGSHKPMFQGHGSLKILQLPWALINFQKHKCPHLVRNNIAIIIKASKQWAVSSLYVLHHTKKKKAWIWSESHPSFVTYVTIKQENGVIPSKAQFPHQSSGDISRH